MKKIAITGGAGQIAYSLLFRLANGELYDEEISLHILEVPEAKEALEGVLMELKDSCFPKVKEYKITTDPYEGFEEVDFAFLVGAKPRSKGMERKDLLKENGAIFVEQGKALNEVAKKTAKVLVVGNPCNTNCLIAMHHAPNLNPANFFAMTRLDQNRAKSFLAEKAKCNIKKIHPIIIWGNHSATQVPDFTHTQIGEKSAEQVIQDQPWLETVFFEKVQKRGAEILQKRGRSSAASAASSALDAANDLLHSKEVFSSGIYSKNNPYNIDPNLIFSFPCKRKGEKVEAVSGYQWNSFIEEKIKITEKELKEERDQVAHFLKGG